MASYSNVFKDIFLTSIDMILITKIFSQDQTSLSLEIIHISFVIIFKPIMRTMKVIFHNQIQYVSIYNKLMVWPHINIPLFESIKKFANVIRECPHRLHCNQ